MLVIVLVKRKKTKVDEVRRDSLHGQGLLTSDFIQFTCPLPNLPGIIMTEIKWRIVEISLHFPGR